jgi:DNA-damage-inducible protein J
MAQSSMLHIRVDDMIKHQATETLASFGMSVSDAVTIIFATCDCRTGFSIRVKSS